MFTTLFMLVYGDYPDMHKKAVTPLLTLDPSRVAVRLWLNTVCPETFSWLLKYAPKHWIIYISSKNVPKYPVMRRLFNDQLNPIVTPWVTWLDDDTHIVKDDWCNKTAQFIETEPTAVFFGHSYWKRHLPGVGQWIRNAAWYTQRAFMAASSWYKNKTIRGTGIAFIRGSYWWLKTETLRALDWPDTRLNHNGGDTALSEAIWQSRQPQHDFHYGITKELAPRRGRSERPAGFKHNYVNRTDGSIASMIDQMPQYEATLAETETSFLRLDSNTLLLGDASKYFDAAALVPSGEVLQLSKGAAQKPAAKNPAAQKPAAKKPARAKTVRSVIRRSQSNTTKNPAAPPPRKAAQNVASYLQALPPVQPTARSAAAIQRKTLKQLLQEQFKKRKMR